MEGGGGTGLMECPWLYWTQLLAVNIKRARSSRCSGPKGSGAAVAPKAVGLPWPQRQLANWFGGSRRNLWTALRAFTVISKDKISELDPEDKNVADTQLELTQLLQEGLNCVSYVGCQEPTATAGLCCAMTY